MPAYKIDSSCSAPPVLHPLGKHRPPHRLRNYWRSIDGTTLVLTKACNWPLAFKQQPSSGDLLLEMAMLHTQRHVCTLIKRKKRTRLEEEGKDRGRKREREAALHLHSRSSVTPLVMLPGVVYLEKIPLMSQPYHPADPVHEWHLSEPRVSPMIRGNSPKGLCS